MCLLTCPSTWMTTKQDMHMPPRASSIATPACQLTVTESTFGNYQAATAKLTLKMGTSCLQTSTRIGVQPTSAIRRRLALGGRRRIAVGRPLITSFTEQNRDAKKQQGSAGNRPPPKKGVVALHNLQHCVKHNTSLEKK